MPSAKLLLGRPPHWLLRIPRPSGTSRIRRPVKVDKIDCFSLSTTTGKLSLIRSPGSLVSESHRNAANYAQHLHAYMSQKKQVSRLHRRQRPRPYAVCDARRLLPEYIGRQHISPNARHRAGITARVRLLMSFGPASPPARERNVKRGARLDAQDFPVACVVTWERSFFRFRHIPNCVPLMQSTPCRRSQ